jgi:GLPGLI family protein
MRNLFFFVLLTTLLTVEATAQVQFGEVTYLRTFTSRADSDMLNNSDLPKAIRDQMATLVANGAFDKRYTLTFAPGRYLYAEQPQEDIEIDGGGSGSIVIHSGSTAPQQWYTDRRDGSFTNSENIADRQFLVSGQLPEVDWTITERQIAPSEATGGFDLQVAEAILENGDTLLAGFARAIPVAFGPMNYGGLPGAILQLTVYREEVIINYTVADFALLPEELELAVPTEGKPVSREKFEQMEKKVKARRG